MAKKKTIAPITFKCYTICLGKKKMTDHGLEHLPEPDPADAVDSLAHRIVMKHDADIVKLDNWAVDKLRECYQAEGYLCEVTIKPVRFYKTTIEVKDMEGSEDL